MRALGIAVLLAVCAVALSRSVDATVLIGADLAGVARAARVVVRGRVIATEGRWTPDHRTIETLVTLQAEMYLKGALGDTVAFAAPGGRLGRYRSIVVGAPTFAVGERVVVFLDARGPTLPFVVGLGQGVYRIVRSPDSQADVVTPPAIVAQGTGPSRVTRGDVSRRAMPVEAFDALVRQLAEPQP